MDNSLLLTETDTIIVIKLTWKILFGSRIEKVPKTVDNLKIHSATEAISNKNEVKKNEIIRSVSKCINAE